MLRTYVLWSLRCFAVYPSGLKWTGIFYDIWKWKFSSKNFSAGSSLSIPNKKRCIIIRSRMAMSRYSSSLLGSLYFLLKQMVPYIPILDRFINHPFLGLFVPPVPGNSNWSPIIRITIFPVLGYTHLRLSLRFMNADETMNKIWHDNFPVLRLHFCRNNAI